MSNIFVRRYEKEISNLIKLGCYNVVRNEENDKEFNVGFYITNKDSMYYSEKEYVIKFKFVYGTKNDLYVYPTKPPNVKFITKVFHPNINYESGTVCVDILTHEDKWTPIYSIESILVSIISLLDDPNPNSPLNSEAARLFKNNTSEFKEHIKAKNIFT